MSKVNWAKGLGAAIKAPMDIAAKQIGDLSKTMSGALMHGGTYINSDGVLKENTIGGFTKELVKYGRGVGAIKNTLYYFVPAGKNAGSGRLSQGMAMAAKKYIQGGMMDGDLRARRYSSGAPIIEDNGSIYSEWKKKAGLGHLPGMLTGTMAGNFTYWRTSDGFTLGIRKNVKTKQVLYGRIPLTYNDNRPPVSVAKYAYAHEYGLVPDVPQRPLMTGLMLGYLEKIDSEWAELFERQMWDSYWFNAIEPTGGVSLSGEGMQLGGTSVNKLATEADPSEYSIQTLYSGLGDGLDASSYSLESISALLERGASTSVSAFDQANFMKLVTEMLGKKGYTNDEIDDILRSVFITGDFEGLL